MINRTVIEGQELKNLQPGEIIRRGKANKGVRGLDNTGIVLDNELFSKHILALGAIGSGKSNLMYHVVNSVLQDITEDDLVIFFDAKGDYMKEFYRDGDIVIGNRKTIPDDYKVTSWNIFEDILISDEDELRDTIREMTTSLFSKKLQNNSQPGFVYGARDILSGIIISIIRDIKSNGGSFDNKKLKELLGKSRVPEIREIISKYSDLVWATSYIMSDNSPTTQSYISPLFMVTQEVFSGPFGNSGDFSMRRAVQNKGGKSIFLEYDIANANTLQPMYTLLIDMAIKEALGHKGRKGNTFFVLDEFPLIPKLEYMDNALNFGRSLGVKIIAGIQNVGQVEYTYGKELAQSILSGYGTYFSFKLFDENSRKIVAERHGKNRVKESMLSTNISKGINDNVVEGNVIEDWDTVKLTVGECIVSLLNEEPFFFKPLLYQTK